MQNPSTSNDNITITTNLDSAPAYAEQLGHICVAWANLEFHMYMLFESLSGSPPAIAKSTFYAVESTRAKREIISATAKFILTKEQDISVLEDILRRIGKTSRQRNKCVHDTLCVAQTQAREVFQMRLSNAPNERNSEEVTIADMQN